MAYPRFRNARAHKVITYSGGSITLNQTAITAVHASALDITLGAQVGDVLEYSFAGRLTSVAQAVGFQAYTVVSGTMTNPFGTPLSATLATAIGHPGWYNNNVAQLLAISGSVFYAVHAGDIVNGAVTARLYYAKTSVTARSLEATTDSQIQVSMKNLGPVDPN
jgi:hypothetical protein